MKYTTWLNYKPKKEHKQTFTEESQTIPNEAYTVKDLMNKFTSGTMPAVQKQTYYDSEANFDYIPPNQRNYLDITEAEEDLRRIKQ